MSTRKSDKVKISKTKKRRKKIKSLDSSTKKETLEEKYNKLEKSGFPQDERNDYENAKEKMNRVF